MQCSALRTYPGFQVLTAGSVKRPNLRGTTKASVFSSRLRSLAVVCGYKFGDFTRKAAQRAKQGIEKLGKEVTGDDSYQFGDVTRKAVRDIKEKLPEAREELGARANTLAERVSRYQFGDITRGALQSQLGQKVVASAQAAGVKLTGREDYQLGDLTMELRARLKDVGDRSAQLLALPDELDELKQVVREQQLLIDSLTGTNKSQDLEVELSTLQITDVASLQESVLEQQDIIDVILTDSETTE